MDPEHFKKLLSHKDLFNVLCSDNYSTAYKKSMLIKADKHFVHSICEMCDNILAGNIKLSDVEHKELKKHKRILRKLVNKSPLKSKRKILSQTGGFLQFLIPAAVSGITSLIESFINRSSSTE